MEIIISLLQVLKVLIDQLFYLTHYMWRQALVPRQANRIKPELTLTFT